MDQNPLLCSPSCGSYMSHHLVDIWTRRPANAHMQPVQDPSISPIFLSQQMIPLAALSRKRHHSLGVDHPFFFFDPASPIDSPASISRVSHSGVPSGMTIPPLLVFPQLFSTPLSADGFPPFSTRMETTRRNLAHLPSILSADPAASLCMKMSLLFMLVDLTVPLAEGSPHAHAPGPVPRCLPRTFLQQGPPPLFGMHHQFLSRSSEHRFFRKPGGGGLVNCSIGLSYLLPHCMPVASL